MTNIPPSIFNDVIGPVMRGPSSSHCAAAVRIGRLARHLMDGELTEILVEFDACGSLATTHHSQGSDMGLYGGLLGWDAADERLADAHTAIRQAGIQVRFEIGDFGDPHPNTYRLTLKNDRQGSHMIALSTGGGMIEVIEIDGLPLSITGDAYETLIFAEGAGEAVREALLHGDSQPAGHEIHLIEKDDNQLVQVKGRAFLDDTTLADLRLRYPIRSVKKLAPALPVLTPAQITLPFTTCAEMLAYNRDKNLALWELALHYESARGDIPHNEVFQRMRQIVSLMEKSIVQGLEGTRYADRILGCQSGSFREAMQAGRLLDGGIMNTIIAYVTSMMEVKSSLGVIVAAPTAGACGGLPGAILGAGHAMQLSLDEMTRAMLAAGLVGVFIAAQATFAAEVCGCQAETGAGSCMAAAGLATLGGGSAAQAVAAASLALQNVLGLICDPIANRVEAPCLGRNVMAAGNALACANMALAGYDPLIPLDEVIETMYRVGQSLPCELRCTGLGGLSVTRSAKAIEARLGR